MAFTVSRNGMKWGKGKFSGLLIVRYVLWECDHGIVSVRRYRYRYRIRIPCALGLPVLSVFGRCALGMSKHDGSDLQAGRLAGLNRSERKPFFFRREDVCGWLVAAVVSYLTLLQISVA